MDASHSLLQSTSRLQCHCCFGVGRRPPPVPAASAAPEAVCSGPTVGCCRIPSPRTPSQPSNRVTHSYPRCCPQARYATDFSSSSRRTFRSSLAQARTAHPLVGHIPSLLVSPTAHQLALPLVNSSDRWCCVVDLCFAVVQTLQLC